MPQNLILPAYMTRIEIYRMVRMRHWFSFFLVTEEMVIVFVHEERSSFISCQERSPCMLLLFTCSVVVLQFHFILGQQLCKCFKNGNTLNSELWIAYMCLGIASRGKSLFMRLITFLPPMSRGIVKLRSSQVCQSMDLSLRLPNPWLRKFWLVLEERRSRKHQKTWWLPNANLLESRTDASMFWFFSIICKVW